MAGSSSSLVKDRGVQTMIMKNPKPSSGTELEEQIALLDHYLDYTQRLCESDMQEGGDQKAEQQ